MKESNKLKCGRALDLENHDDSGSVDNNRSAGSGRESGSGSGEDKGQPFIWKEISTTNRRHWETKLSLTLSLLSSTGHQDIRMPMCCTKLYKRTKTLVSSQDENIHANVTNRKTSVDSEFQLHRINERLWVPQSSSPLPTSCSSIS